MDELALRGVYLADKQFWAEMFGIKLDGDPALAM